MIGLLRAMFATPEAQANAYTWAAVLMGHWAIGAALTVLLMAVLLRPLTCAALVSATYGLIWEGGQLLAGGGAWDGIADWTTVTLGALTIAAVWQHRRRLAAGAIGAIVTVLAAGIRRRK